MLDGTILGVHQTPEAFVAAMRKLRSASLLSPCKPGLTHVTAPQLANHASLKPARVRIGAGRW